MLERSEKGSSARWPLVAQVSSVARAKFLEMQSVAGPAAAAATATAAATAPDAQAQPAHPEISASVVETNLISEFGNRNLETSVGWLGSSPDEREEFCLVFALFGTQLNSYINIIQIFLCLCVQHFTVQMIVNLHISYQSQH